MARRAGRRRVGSAVLKGRRSTGRRVYVRDSKGRFARTPGGSSPDSSDDDAKRKKRRRTAGGVTVAVGAIAATQARSTSVTRTAMTRRRIVKAHVGRARADHARHVSRRNRVFPTEALSPRRFDAKAARAEGRTLTKGYRKQLKSVRKASRNRQ